MEVEGKLHLFVENERLKMIDGGGQVFGSIDVRLSRPQGKSKYE